MTDGEEVRVAKDELFLVLDGMLVTCLEPMVVLLESGGAPTQIKV